MRKLLCIAAMALCWAGCSGSPSLNCPTNTAPAGNFTLTLALQHTPDECVVMRQADGGPGPLDGSIVPSPQAVSSALCAANTDAGATLYMVVANSSLVRQSPLDSDGGFTFVSPTLPQAQTLCNCTSDVNESISGTLLGAGDGGFSVIADAGLVPQPTQIAGSVVQTLTPNPTDAGCLCNMPCAEHYTLTGTPNR
jgi:hypothetical protein